MSNYVFAAGGSGARIAEALSYIAAMGLMGVEGIHVVFCDKDTFMGNRIIANEALDNYQNIHNSPFEQGTAFFRTPMSSSDWSFDCDDQGNAQFSLIDLLNSDDAINPDAEKACKSLFLDNYVERNQKIYGFLCKPNMGVAVIQASILKGEDNAATSQNSSYFAIKQEMKAELNNGKAVNIFFFGSVFGGTGASAIPTIAKDLTRTLGDYIQQNNARGTFRIGAAMLLPYMRIPGNSRDNLVSNDTFNASAKSAMAYYFTRAKGVFERIYPIGLPDTYLVPGEPEYGGKEQKDPSNIVEWVAAMACQHFFTEPAEKGAQRDALFFAGLTAGPEGVPYTLDARSFMNAAFPSAFRRWCQFAAFYLLYLYPGICCGRAGKSPGNWYNYHISSDPNNEAIDMMDTFLRRFCEALSEVLGGKIEGNNPKPNNLLVNARNFRALTDFLSKYPHTMENEREAFSAGQKLVNGCLQISLIGSACKVDSNDLQKVISNSNGQIDGFSGLIRIVDDFLKSKQK